MFNLAKTIQINQPIGYYTLEQRRNLVLTTSRPNFNYISTLFQRQMPAGKALQ